jgi:glycosyltransferase involved in cell wall biosynthesis
LSPHKGQADLIKAAPVILKEYPDVHFVLVGDPMKHERNYANELEKLAVELKVKDRIHFAGFQSNIPGILKSFTISVVPSWEEPFGLTIIESMAAKVPVAATNSAGAAEIIENGVNGYLSESMNPDTLAKSIVKILQDKKRIQELSRSGFQTVTDKFSLDMMIEKTRNLYLDILLKR